jgi:uncharacterized protein (TIGR00304 family)
MIDIMIIGVALILIGIFVVFISLLFALGKPDKDTEVRGGAVIMIGPIPIIFGSDSKWATLAILLAIALVVVGLLYYVI